MFDNVITNHLSVITRDGNEYPVNQVLARTSDYRIPKSVFGYFENLFL